MYFKQATRRGMAAGGYKATLIGGGQRSEGMAELGWGMVSNARNMIRTGGKTSGR